jgi:hypothetical protein
MPNLASSTATVGCCDRDATSLPPLLQLSHIQPPQLHNAMTHAITKTTHFTTAGTSCGSIGLCNTSSRVTVINKIFAANLHWDQVIV